MNEDCVETLQPLFLEFSRMGMNTCDHAKSVHLGAGLKLFLFGN